ncbi:MAG: hypothetical protein KME29_05150 [Calothrix sp. FI2-JRJ7]|jgi:hypothetical protein|nr:hypothetical protein [Calothrix sp. FI2-JRJ7]
MHQEFHNWLKVQDFHPNYPDAFKVFDFAQQFPTLVKLPSQDVNNCATYNRAAWLYSQYESKRGYFLKLDFWSLCRQWRSQFGKEWKEMFREGYKRGKYFSGNWYPMLLTLEDKKNPSDYGFALGRNTTVWERR